MKLSLIVYLYLIALSLSAQSYKHIGIEQGLPGNRVYKIIEDDEGFIWIATDKGLAKFDGDYFKVFNIKNGLPANDIWEIFQTSDQKLWFFTLSNKFGYILNGKVYNFESEQNELMYPVFFATTRNRIIFNSFGNNYILKNNQWQYIRDSVGNKLDKVSCLISPEIKYFKAIIRSDSLSSVINFFDHRNRIVYSTLTKRGFRRIDKQINDSLVVIREYHGLTFFNLNDLSTHTVIEPELFGYDDFVRVTDTPNGIQISSKNFWAKLNSHYQLQDVFRFPENLHIFSAIKDSQGNFWGITFSNGIYFFPKNSLNARPYLKGQMVQFVKKIKGKLFAGVLNQGIFRYDEKKQKFEIFHPIKEYLYDIMYSDDNNFAVFGGNTTFIRTDKLSGEFFRVGKSGIFFKNGFAVRDNTGIKIFNQDFKQTALIPVKSTRVMLGFDGRILAGNPQGLYVIDKTNIKPVKWNNRSTMSVISLAQINRQVIIGTEGYGAYVWDGVNPPELIAETQDLMINDIFVSDNEFWLASEKGVLAYRLNTKPELQKILRKTDGLISDQVNHVVVHGQKIFTSNYSGIVSVDKNQSEIFPIKKIYYKSIKYNDAKVDTITNEVYYKNNNSLLINFGLIDYSGQEHNKYYYKLLPVQSEWVEIQSKSINFSNLQPDKYALQIKVTNPYRQQLVKTYRFAILPLWWQRDVSKLLFVLFALGLIFFIGYFTRKKELKKQKEKLLAQKQMAEFELHALRSQMNPHFVFNSLNAILYYINDENFDKSETYLIRFSRLIRMIFEFSRQKTIYLKQEIDLLKSYLDLEKMRFGDNFQYCFYIDPALDIGRTTIPTLLLQPILENAVNHGIFHKKGKGTVCLEFHKTGKYSYQVIIKDDGVGIEKSKEINQNSLKKHISRSTQILLDRIKLLNLSGKWQISYQIKDTTQSDDPYNTVVILKINLL